MKAELLVKINGEIYATGENVRLVYHDEFDEESEFEGELAYIGVYDDTVDGDDLIDLSFVSYREDTHTVVYATQIDIISIEKI